MSDIRRQDTDPGLIELYDYWLARRGSSRRMPARGDIDPLHLPLPHLPDLMLIDVIRFSDRIRYRYRLVGTHVVAATGEDRTGRFFDEFAFFAMNPAVLTQYDAVVRTGAPLHSREPFHDEERDTFYEAERLLLPLSGDDRTVDMILVMFRFKTGPYTRR